MNDIERLAHASTALANHVAAVVRLSNSLFAILRDGDRDDIDPETRRVILRAAKEEHEAFRAEHFRGIISNVNAVVEITDKMYQAEPVLEEPVPEEPTRPEEPLVPDVVQNPSNAPTEEDPVVRLDPNDDPGAKAAP